MAFAGILVQLFRLEIDQAESALISRNRELTRISATDPLTGLANRRTMDSYLEEEWQRLEHLRSPLSVVLLDVDHFKPYNDLYGHPAGDECLQRVAGILSHIAQHSGGLAARYGGEEFAIVLPGRGSEDAYRIAEQARTEVMDLSIRHENSDVLPQVTLSVGVASAVPGTIDNAYELLRYADEALYAAKRNGRNQVIVGPSHSCTSGRQENT
ncbi:diguanylate cyclase (GGDEF)-like protein [Thioalkalivibrio sp. ALE21]|nr:diguanylate cyclase (GGDEF)-like protein [Thioalkalivibrio sp. ALE21]